MTAIRLIVILFLWSAPAYANDKVNFSVYEDVLGVASVPQLVDENFTAISAKEIKFGFSSSVFWIKAESDYFQQDNLLLSSCYNQIDSLIAFIAEEDGWREIQTGDRLRFEQRDVNHPCFVFDLSSSTGSTAYFRLQSGGVIKAPFKIYEKESFWEQQQSEQFLQGFYLAFMAAMFVYNLFLFLVVLDSAYLFYVGYLAGIALFLGSMSGHTKMYLWPNWTVWADIAPIALVSFAIASGIIFISKLAMSHVYAPLISKFISIFAPLFVLVIAAQAVYNFAGFLAVGVYTIIALTLASIVVVVAASKRYPPAYFLSLTILLMFPAAITYYGHITGQIEDGWLSRNLLYLTSSAEAMILSFALAFKIRMLNQEIELHQRQAITEQSNFSRSLLKAADNERRGIARELHDSVGQGLLVVKNLIKRIDSNEERQQAVNQLQHLISDTRNMARNMYPQQIETLGFSTALKTMLTETISSDGIELTLHLADVDGQLTKDAELHLYRIAQEAASNIIKHAKASRVSCDLRVEDGCLWLIIKENGIGIPVDIEYGMGILNMRERAAIIGAHMDIAKIDPTGTSLCIEVPIL